MQQKTLRTEEKIKLVKEGVEKLLKDEENKPFIRRIQKSGAEPEMLRLRSEFSMNSVRVVDSAALASPRASEYWLKPRPKSSEKIKIFFLN